MAPLRCCTTSTLNVRVVKLWCCPSGAGKSSLLRVLNLLETADNGQLHIANQSFDFSTHPTEQQGLALRRKVGMVFQQYHLWPHMTVLENLVEAP